MENTATTGYRLSPVQERIRAQQRAGDSAPFVVTCVVMLEGALGRGRLQNAIRNVVARHEVLRTTYHRQPGMTTPFQVIHDDPVFTWIEADLTGIPEPQRSAEFHKFFSAAPADVQTGPLLRVGLMKLSAERQALLLSLPALSADSATFTLLVSETAQFYADPATPADDVMQYVDVGEWQHELLQSEDTKAGREYWRDYWRSFHPSTISGSALPYSTWTLDSAAFLPAVNALFPKTTAAIDEAAAKSGVPVAVFLAACWQILLMRLGGAPEITIGVACNGRRHEELKSTTGALTSYLPLRSTFESDAALAAFAKKVNESRQESSKWQDTFTWPPDRGDVFPAAFEYIDAGEEVRAGDLRLRIDQIYSCTERFKLKLVVMQMSGERRPSSPVQSELRLELHYDRNRYSEQTITRLAEQFSVLLADATANPQKPVSELQILPAAERQQLLGEWNRTERPYPANQTIVSLFEAQARKTPARVAVLGGGQQLSYAELNARANQLAHFLRQHGVGPDVLVGLCIDRSAELMVAILGILKAGGAYVPLNPDNPRNRLEQQLSGVQVLVTQQALSEKLPTIATTVCLDRDAAQLAQQPDTDPAPNAEPEHLAYIIYTSGSTGVPKGVQIEHRNLANYAQFICERLELGKSPDGLQFATVSTIAADLGNTCIFPALISGGTVHLISYDEATDVARLGRYVDQQQIDALKIVPSHLAALLATDDGRKVLPRKYLITGGEALTQKLLDRIAQLNATCEVVNHYGPTETTVGSLTLKLSEHAGRVWDTSTIPIGCPIANTRVYILDKKLQPVPVGVIGELYIAGAGVGRGYRNQPEMTAERFLNDPFVSDPQARMYKTGDLARYLIDGNVEFLGRGDDQVKVRGYRIELGEIEAALASNSGVKQSVVLAREDQETGEKKLVAYVVIHREHPATIEDLRKHLRNELPDYMVPSAIVLLDKLPLNANGKVDRQALPAPEDAPPQQKAYVAPRTPVEEVVANIWAEVLRIKQVSIDDNFFELGGHSLLATQVVSRMRRTLGVELPLRTMFEAPTVAKLAQSIEQTRRNAEGRFAPPPITPVPRDRDLPLSFAQQRLWFLDQLQPNNPLYNIPRAARLRGKLNLAALQRSLNEIIRRHESQRTVFKSVRGQPVQVILPPFPVDLPVIDLSELADPEDKARNVAIAEGQRSFDLEKGPLLRASLIKLADDDHVLLLNTHHIVSDAWSAAIMADEIRTLYNAFVAGKDSPLPDLKIQYADFATWQREWLQGQVMENQLAHWKKTLAGVSPVLELPTDRPRPNIRTPQGAYELVTLPEDLTDTLNAFSRREGSTLFMTLVTAFETLLSRYSGQERLVVGTDMANRTTVDTERLIGFFINVLPIRGDFSGDPSFREALRRVRDAALGAYAHQDMPLEKLVEELQPERAMSHNPLIQALFVMQNTPRAETQFGDLKLEPFELGVTNSKFDLAVFMVERGNAITASWLYSMDLFDRSTIQRMAGNYERLLRSAVAEPDTRISALEMFSDEEKASMAQESQHRKKSQLKKFLNAEPKAVSLSEARAASKE